MNSNKQASTLESPGMPIGTYRSINEVQFWCNLDEVEGLARLIGEALEESVGKPITPTPSNPHNYPQFMDYSVLYIFTTSEGIEIASLGSSVTSPHNVRLMVSDATEYPNFSASKFIEEFLREKYPRSDVHEMWFRPRGDAQFAFQPSDEHLYLGL